MTTIALTSNAGQSTTPSRVHCMWLCEPESDLPQIGWISPLISKRLLAIYICHKLARDRIHWMTAAAPQGMGIHRHHRWTLSVGYSMQRPDCKECLRTITREHSHTERQWTHMSDKTIVHVVCGPQLDASMTLKKESTASINTRRTELYICESRQNLSKKERRTFFAIQRKQEVQGRGNRAKESFVSHMTCEGKKGQKCRAVKG
ncbi:hypothetical protein B0O80DRAFT_116937 [Mortierella sp. GBAus27b]|nr:hypothetical protein B0O80DRAFT_116937 [Mortierella sp. GBAus27b]